MAKIIVEFTEDIDISMLEDYETACILPSKYAPIDLCAREQSNCDGCPFNVIPKIKEVENEETHNWVQNFGTIKRYVKEKTGSKQEN